MPTSHVALADMLQMTAWCCRILRNDKSIIDKDTKAKATFNLAIALLSYDKGPPYKYMNQDFPAPTYEVQWSGTTLSMMFSTEEMSKVGLW